MTEFRQDFQDAQAAFLTFIDGIEKEKISQISVRRAIKKYDVKNLKINNVTPLRAKKMYTAITSKYSNGITTDKSWLENERRLFIWCTLCYLHENKLEIKDLRLSDFQFLQKMFPKKDLNLIKFQIYSLVKRDNKSSGWDAEEETLLRKLVNKQSQKDIEWSNISKQFFIESQQRFFRNAKQCRQRWLNYLDPNKQKGKWLKQQDIILMKQVLEKGKKWSKIVEALEGKKNQHMIKNRYKSLIHKKEKQCKSLKLKQNDIIKLILRGYDQNQASDSPHKSEEIQQESSKSDEQGIVESQDSNVEKANLSQKELEKHEDYIKQEHTQNKNSNFLKGFNSWPIVIQNNTMVGLNKQKNGKQFKNQDPEKDNQKQFEFFGSKADKQFVNNLFFSVNTPVAEENRFYASMFESRSPFLTSPYAAWTPSIVFNEDPQALQSPLGFSDFSSTARNFTNSMEKKS